ncbi:hypothetical protein Gotur_015453 [Gossypium turneri]
MGKLPSSFILRSVVNSGSHLSNFLSFSSSSNTIATYIEGQSKKPMSMPVRGKGKRDHCFDNVDHALSLFNKMIEKYPKPSIVEFTKLFAAIVRMKRYAIVVSKYRQIELLGVSHDEPSAVTFSTLINGLCNQSKITEAVCMFDEMTERGYEPNLIAYNIVFKGLSKTGNTDRAVRFLRLMESRGFEPNIVAYNTILDCLCQQKEATRLLNEMVDNNISLDIIAYNLLIDALYKEGMISKAVETVDMMRKQGIEPNVVTYNTLVDAHCKEGMVSEAEDIVDAIIKRGIEPDVVTYSALINGHCLQNEMDKARRVFNLMIEKGCAPDIVTYNTMINVISKMH